jgi:hypothetical protein
MVWQSTKWDKDTRTLVILVRTFLWLGSFPYRRKSFCSSSVNFCDALPFVSPGKKNGGGKRGESRVLTLMSILLRLAGSITADSRRMSRLIKRAADRRMIKYRGFYYPNAEVADYGRTLNTSLGSDLRQGYWIHAQELHIFKFVFKI